VVLLIGRMEGSNLTSAVPMVAQDGIAAMDGAGWSLVLTMLAGRSARLSGSFRTA